MRRILLKTAAFSAACMTFTACSKSIDFTVNAGEFDRTDCIVKTALVNIPRNAALFETTGDGCSPVASQIVEDANGKWLYFKLEGESPAGSERSFSLRTSKSGALPAMTASDDGDNIVLRSGEKEILSYRHSVDVPAAGIRKIFSRSGFIHPVKTPSGFVVTNIRPDDHFHHFGIWNPWTRVIFDGSMYDLWNIGDSLGTVRARDVEKLYAGAVLSGFDATLEHIIYAPDGEKKIMDESLAVRAFDEGEAFLWDFDSNITNCTDTPVTFQAYRYQGFCLRATALWHNGTCSIRSSEGLDRNFIDGTRARWIYVNGDVDGVKSGILFMSCPANHNFPEHIRVWDETQNAGRGDIMLNICPAKFEDWVLEPGSVNELQYRVYAFDGEMDDQKAERLWTDFAYPPTIIRQTA